MMPFFSILQWLQIQKNISWNKKNCNNVIGFTGTDQFNASLLTTSILTLNLTDPKLLNGSVKIKCFYVSVLKTEYWTGYYFS